MDTIMKTMWDFMQIKIMPDLIPGGISLLTIFVGNIAIGLAIGFLFNFGGKDND